MSLKAFAPAKINLFLHVGPVQPDGYHPVASWMVFADVGDEVRLDFAAEGHDFAVDGPMAAGVPLTADNLVLRARDAVLQLLPGILPPFNLSLTKRLPAASGIGGGSSDAAATLRLLGKGLTLSKDGQMWLAERLGSDVPACLRGDSLIAEGRGEVLSAAPASPELHAVLVNPGVGVSTGAVFRLYDQGPAGDAVRPALPAAFADAQSLTETLRGCRNDLEAPAKALQPVIGEVLAILDAAEECLFARMSGSGATCFALCADETSAKRLASKLFRSHPAWWVRACRLGGPWPDDFTNS